jgi:hypothetical protein
MGLLDKVKAGAEQAAAKARDEMQELQTKRELGQAYDELGKKAFELAERGEFSHAEISELVNRVRSLKAQLEAEEGGAVAAEASTEPPPSSQPPAMPV